MTEHDRERGTISRADSDGAGGRDRAFAFWGYQMADSSTMNLERVALERLIDQWRDPEFWRTKGSAMDSLDCADELRRLLHPITVGTGVSACPASR